MKSIINVLSSFYSQTFHFLVIYLKAQVIGEELEAGDDLSEVKWFSFGEELPDLAFDEDWDMLELYISGKHQEFPMDAVQIV